MEYRERMENWQYKNLKIYEAVLKSRVKKYARNAQLLSRKAYMMHIILICFKLLELTIEKQ